jgi:Rrf2 family nitric oxide-sensitive transcriptional repressor
MRLTTRTNLAMRTLMYCAVNSDRLVRKADVATACHASLNHLGLVINQLGQGGFITTSRGRNGGIRLARPAQAISLGAVCRYMEADVPFAECFPGGENLCPLTACCRLRGVLGDAIEAFYATLDGVTLDDITRDNAGLVRLLALQDAAA